MHYLRCLMLLVCIAGAGAALGADKPDCERTYTLALHEHGLLYSADTGSGIDKDIADELVRRSGCKVVVSVMPRARIWQLIESGALDFSLTGITNAERDRFAGFAWYVSNKYYLLVRKDAGVGKLADFERATPLKLGVIRSFRYSASANELVDRLNVQGRVINSNSLEPLYQSLLSNRIQAMTIEPFDYPAVESARIRDATEILEFGDPPVLHGLIESRASLSKADLESWRALIEAMRADGTMQRIFQKYFKPELVKAMLSF